MGLGLPAFNLMFGKGCFPYQDVMRRRLIQPNARSTGSLPFESGPASFLLFCA
jgi:hypothetical protein